MKSYLLWTATLFASTFFYNCDAQIQHTQTVTAKIFGNCGMCEKTIEKAAFQKGVAKADWDQTTKMAVISFDSTKTNMADILRRIADAGYDSEQFRASDDTYASLHSCCQYDRPEPTATGAVTPPTAVDTTPPATPVTAPAKTGMIKKSAAPQTAGGPVAGVYAAYFRLKDAFIGSDATAAATQAGTLASALKNVNKDALTADQQTTWMKYVSKLTADAEKINGSGDIEKQRAHFVTLSDHLIAVMKVIKTDGETYVDHCPMANDGKGANWLSKEKPIKNPYYGASMLTCGKVKETLQQ